MADIPTTHEHAAAGHGHTDEAHAHSPNLAHHFDTPIQQFDSAKLGMWLFLATEILLFGGLFCAYAILRANHPEMFIEGHKLLDKKMGAINTVVLLVSSFTMAWGVRAAQQGKTKLLVTLLTITFLCGSGFMVVKFFEYKAKAEHGSLWGRKFNPETVYGLGHASNAGGEHAGAATTTPTSDAAHASKPADAHAATPADPHAPATPAPASPAATGVDAWNVAAPGSVPVAPVILTRPGEHSEHPEPTHNLHVFFGLYFCMTGLHGLHVLAGMTVIAWLIRRSIRGDFSSGYFTPVDLGGLYWHLVDLIWIYLFPLLYLIH